MIAQHSKLARGSRILRRSRVFGGFAALLAIYIALLIFGPAASTAQGAAIQATAQKIIVYASIVTVLIQAIAARRYNRNATI